ncbi:MAG: acetate--CoA ligase [Deltaproteobacteria bacterium]|nr:acetate--CoA ligase [Deltaproteobacteria bacterium]
MSEHIDVQLQERRTFPPPQTFADAAHIKSMKHYTQLCAEADASPEKFWAKQAESLRWQKPFERVLEWNAPFAKWFIGGELNVSDNCLDRHAEGARKNKPAIIFEGEPGDKRTLTYAELKSEVCKLANGMKSLGVKKGDRVAIYLPMIPEAAIAMLACARIGATHSVVFGGFSADALKDRINDCGCKLVITADGGWRRGTIVPLKKNVDDALKHTPTIEKVIVVRRTQNEIAMQSGRDVEWSTLVGAQSADCPPEKIDSEHPLFILYTSGTTGKPKGVVHTTGGYLLHATLTTKWVFDLKEDDIFWCTADVGWVTGHSYVVYGPLSNGATVLLYEGAPNHPAQDRFWDIIERYKATIFYTAPTAIRAFMKWGDEHPNKHDLSSLRLLGTVGEPINPEAWIWYNKTIGKERCPIVDTWWQTETGGIIASPLPGATPTKPGSCTLPLPGLALAVVDKKGAPVGPNQGGYLVIQKPWPSMLRTVWGDPERYAKTYFSDYPGIYFTGDGARRDEDGYFWVMGRVDDVLNVAGHRLGTMEVESALVSHPKVAEAAVVGRPDDLKGQAVVAFVTLKSGHAVSDALKDELKGHVVKEIGAIARPDDIRFADALPKTRSGKIMRRLLRELAAGGAVKGDTTTLEDFSVLDKLRADDE